MMFYPFTRALWIILFSFCLNLNVQAQESFIDAELLHAVVEHNDVAEFRNLLEHDIDINTLSDDGSSLLYNAIKVGDLEMINLLIKAGANINLGNVNSGWVPLSRAVYDNRIDIVAALLKAGANPNQATNDGWAPLHFTVNSRNYQQHAGLPLIQYLLEHGADINQLTNANQSALYLSIRNHHVNEAAFLIAHAADPNLVLNSGHSPLMFAIHTNQLALVDALIKAGADVNLTNNNQENALHYAVAQRDKWPHNGTPFLKLLLSAGANPNQQNEWGATPLYLAAIHERTEEALALLEAKADVNLTENSGWSPLHAAADINDLVMMDAMIKAGADITYALESGSAVLHTSVRSSNRTDTVAAIEMLLQSGADINQLDMEGNNALGLAAIAGNVAAFNTLVDHKADFKLGRTDGRNLLHFAVVGANPQIIKTVLEHGLDISAKDNKGVAPIHKAVRRDADEPDATPVLQLLIDYGADVSRITDDGVSVLMMAAHLNRKNEAKLLIDSGADLLAENPNDENKTAQDYAYLAGNLDIAIMITKKLRTKQYKDLEKD